MTHGSNGPTRRDDRASDLACDLTQAILDSEDAESRVLDLRERLLPAIPEGITAVLVGQYSGPKALILTRSGDSVLVDAMRLMLPGTLKLPHEQARPPGPSFNPETDVRIVDEHTGMVGSPRREEPVRIEDRLPVEIRKSVDVF